MSTNDLKPKRYKCRRCGHVVTQTTNHYGDTWSFGNWNCCPNCPPWAKYPEFGGQTVWECIDVPDTDPHGAVGAPELDAADNRKCTHRDGDGHATDSDSGYCAGDECPFCGCALGTDGYWYIDSDQAPRSD